MEETYYLIGWENDFTINYHQIFYVCIKDEELVVNTDMDNAMTFENKAHAKSKLSFLKESYPEYNWCILIEIK